MTEPDHSNQPQRPTGSLLRSAFWTLLGAIIVTVFFIMPAEYGVDPTGVGQLLGLTDLEDTQATAVRTPGEKPNTAISAFPAIPDTFDYYEPEVLGDPYSRSHQSPFRSDTLEVPLDDLEQVEIKVVMKQGDALVYSWKMTEGETVYADFHADPHQTEFYPENYWIRYAESENPSASGSLVAPFDGNHGWFWMNIEEKPVRIILEVRGFYERLEEISRSYQ